MIKKKNLYIIFHFIVGEVLICNTHDMSSVSFEWHSQAVSELLWFVKSDHQIILASAGRDGYICIGTMVGDKIKFTQQLCRYELI